MTNRDHVVQDDSSVRMHDINDLLWRRLETCDEDGNTMLDCDIEVVIEPVVGLVDDVIDGDGADRGVWGFRF